MVGSTSAIRSIFVQVFVVERIPIGDERDDAFLPWLGFQTPRVVDHALRGHELGGNDSF